MSRTPSSTPEALARALETAQSTNSAIELRRALAVTLPSMHGLSLRETAAVLGRSEVWVAKERRRFMLADVQGSLVSGSGRGGRRNQLIPADEEDEFMEEVCRKYMKVRTAWRFGLIRGSEAYRECCKDFIQVVQEEIERRIQRKTTRTSVYNLMERTGRRRFPDYKPYMWRIACEQQIPGSIYDVSSISEGLAKRFGLRLKKPRPGK